MHMLKKYPGKAWTAVLLSSILAFSLPCGAHAATTTLNPAEDSYVHQSNPTNNYGTAANLYVKNDTSASRYAFLKFNVSGISGVTSAKLRVYGSASASTALSAYQTTDGWSQAAITWNNMPAVGSLAGSVPINTTVAYNEIDVTSYVSAEAAGDGVVSFALQESVGKYTTLNSTDNAANKPELLIVNSGSGGTGGDTQAPTAPTGLAGTAASSSQINLSWGASTDNVGVTGYDVYRNGAFLKNVTGTSTSDTGLSASTTYTYYVKAKDAAGNASAQSSTVSATTQSGGAPACSGALNSAAAIQAAMAGATPGSVIVLAPGTYAGNRATSGDPKLDGGGVPTGVFYSGSSGAVSSHIVLKSCDPANPAILTGAATDDGSYGIHLTGDYWEIRDVKVTTAQKGIMLDNANNNLIYGAEVYNVGDEGVHFRDGSSYNTLDSSNIHDTGKYQAGYGEGAYVGSDESAAYEHTVVNNTIRYTTFGPGITAEHIDIKEGADGTLVENSSFNGTGISGANSADSFIDVKGINSKIYNNTGSRNGNANVVDAFQNRTHGSTYPTGTNNDFNGNSVNLDGVGYVVNAVGGTAIVHGNTRSDGSMNVYKGHYTAY